MHGCRRVYMYIYCYCYCCSMNICSLLLKKTAVLANGCTFVVITGQNMHLLPSNDCLCKIKSSDLKKYFYKIFVLVMCSKIYTRVLLCMFIPRVKKKGSLMTALENQKRLFSSIFCIHAGHFLRSSLSPVSHLFCTDTFMLYVFTSK